MNKNCPKCGRNLTGKKVREDEKCIIWEFECDCTELGQWWEDIEFKSGYERLEEDARN